MSLSRRHALRLLGIAAAIPLVSSPSRASAQSSFPITGRALPGMDALDAIVVPIMQAHGVPGVSIAIARDGKLKLARGYGYANVQANAPMRPDTRIALASVSKVITGQTILKLVDQGRVRLTDRAFDYFRDLAPPPGMREDPRLNDITIEMCLHHTGGWDRKTSGDPSGWGPRIMRALRLNQPPTPFEMIRYMKGVPLDFTPGTQQVYSNFGFALLGGVIAKVTAQGYPEVVQQTTLRPMGATGLRVDDAPPRYLDGEARRYLIGSEHEVPGGNPRMVMAAGGWQASCVDMARFITAIDGSRTGTTFLSAPTFEAMLSPAVGIQRESPDHWMGLGWDYVQAYPGPDGGKRYSYGKDGGIGGIQAYLEHLAIGADFVLLVNSAPADTTTTPGGRQMIQPKLVDFIRQTPAPDGDLFASFT